MDEFSPIYHDIKENLKGSERARVRNVTVDVIRRNSNTNEERLSMDIVNIFGKDQGEFRKFLDCKRPKDS
jgi:hypothetical protein